jgi:hypothetical protein
MELRRLTAAEEEAILRRFRTAPRPMKAISVERLAILETEYRNALNDPATSTEKRVEVQNNLASVLRARAGFEEYERRQKLEPQSQSNRAP